jgi:hypothetical protein
MIVGSPHRRQVIARDLGILASRALRRRLPPRITLGKLDGTAE